MRSRKLRITALINGMETALGEVKIVKFAKVREPDTALVCPSCGAEPKWSGGYDCSCGAKYNHWSRLKRVLKATLQEIIKVKFTDGESVDGKAYVLDRKEFADKYSDAILEEKGIVADNPTTARNIRNLLIATRTLNKVVVVSFKDTYEERTCLLTLSESNRVLLREIIPQNILDLEETMRADLTGVSEKDIEAAKRFVDLLPAPTEDVFLCHDYRAAGVEAVEKPSEKGVELEAILAKAEQSKLTSS